MTDHYVRHVLRGGDSASVEFECRAPEDAYCRSWCSHCIDDRGQSICTCEDDEPERTPNIISGRPCNILDWLNDTPEECYDGPEGEPVRGPGWQPMQATWEGDYYVWEYAEEAT